MLESPLARITQYFDKADKTDYIGESVSQLTHALQCAYFATKKNHSEAVILAALFHDIGHFAHDTTQSQMGAAGVHHHEWIGAKLAYDIGLSAKVALLIGYHVDAKRYLAAKKANYYARLSPASRETLTFQGGPMAADEMRAFEQHPCFKEILQVRVNDEEGKVAELSVPSIQDYWPMISKHIESNRRIQQTTQEIALVNFVDDQWVWNLKRYLEERID